MTRETRLARTMVDLADTLVDDFDIVDLLTTLAQRCVEVLDTAAAGIVLFGPDGALHAAVSSSEAMRVVELFELQLREGPCYDCLTSGEPVVTADLAAAASRWPSFAPVAVRAGFRAADAVPMRRRTTVIGALNLFRTATGSRPEDDVAIAQGLADIATIALLQHRQAIDAGTLNAQLLGALHSRVVIEQAKGVIAEREDVSTDEAFTRIRRHARNHNMQLAVLAAAIVAGTVTLTSDR